MTDIVAGHTLPRRARDGTVVFRQPWEIAMLRILALATALALAAGAVSAQTIDAKGKCHDAKGKMAKMEVCKPAAAPAAGAPNCKTGKLCGKTCIAKDKVCHIK